MSDYRLWVSEDRCILVRLWGHAFDVTAPATDSDELMEVAFRETPEHTWGPPITLQEENTHTGLFSRRVGSDRQVRSEELSELMFRAAIALRLCSNRAETDEWRDDLRKIQRELEATAGEL